MITFFRRLIRYIGRVRKRFRSELERRFAAWGARSPYRAAFYYLLMSPAFRREQQAFLCGRLRYETDTLRPKGSAVMLRRNTHRLEKGLLMRPRRIPFAVSYIGETLECYERIMKNRGSECFINEAEWNWSHDVLKEYFEIHDGQPAVAGFRKRFQSLPAPSALFCKPQTPYIRDLTESPPVTYPELLKLAELRRSVRWFLPRPVSRELIDQALTVAGLSPSACNRQPYCFRIFDEPALVRRIASIPPGSEGYSDQVPVVIVVVGRQRSYFSERDRHLIYIDGSLATMAFLFALETQGIGTCCINWADIEEREKDMAHVLGLEPDERPVMLIALGYPDPNAMVARSTKKPLDEIRSYNSVSHAHRTSGT